MSSALAGPGIGPETSPEVDLGRLAADAPEEIAEDLTVVTDALGSYYEAIAASGIDFSDPASLTLEAIPVMEEAAAVLDTPELRDASDRVAAWFEENRPAP